MHEEIRADQEALDHDPDDEEFHTPQRKSDSPQLETECVAQNFPRRCDGYLIGKSVNNPDPVNDFR